MSLKVPVPPGIERMMKQGSQRHTGLEDGVYRNIEACIELVKYITSTYGPNGRSKMVINYIEKLYVTSDCSTIIKELDVQHPACKLMVMAAQHQERECGDGTTEVLLLCAELLQNAMRLLRSGLPLKDVVSGYQEALDFCLATIPELVVQSTVDLQDKKSVISAIRTPITSKQCGLEFLITNLVSDACMSIMQSSANFSVDSVRICRILGSSLGCSYVVNGMVLRTKPESVQTEMYGAKVVAYSCAFDIAHTETKGTVLIKTADELIGFSKSEEKSIEQQVRDIKDTGCNVIVSMGKIGDIHKHFANQFGLLLVRLTSKFELRRLCLATGATCLPKIIPPTRDTMGECESVCFEEIGSTPVVVFKQGGNSSISTVILRGSSDHMMLDVEKALDDGINAFKSLTKDSRILPGGGAVEVELASRLQMLAKGCPGPLEQASLAFLGVVRLIGDKGHANTVFGEHVNGKTNSGLIVGVDTVRIGDVVEAGVLDLLSTKQWVVKNAFSTAITLLKIDEVIMSKPAGGPRARETGTNALRDGGLEED